MNNDTRGYVGAFEPWYAIRDPTTDVPTKRSILSTCRPRRSQEVKTIMGLLLLVLWVVVPPLILREVNGHTAMLRKGFNETIDGLNSIEERLSKLDHLASVRPAPSPASDTDGQWP